MITQKTLEAMWSAGREIKACDKLLKDLTELETEHPYRPEEQKLKDVFGRRQDFQLGVPSGKSGHRLFGVHPDLAKSIIIAHKSKMMAEIGRLNEQAKIEANNDIFDIGESE